MKVVINGFEEYAVKLQVVVTVIYWYVDPTGTVTVSEVVVAAVTVAFVAPKKTILLAGNGSNPVPVIVTTVPTGPDMGENELIMGGPGQKNSSLRSALNSATCCLKLPELTG